ncbi:divergent PAP2 family protein [Candidatus Saccharibacteria bacterium]|nr:divergent PAP2 family protein [Candidatus Saccharibacteria bacterium]
MIELSPYIAAIILAWTLSQFLKYALTFTQPVKLTFRGRLFVSGGMPSSHSATIMAVWTVILLLDGWTSGLFGLASALALIVTYDAVKVRRSSGEQGVALLALMKEQKSKVPLPRVALGHTPLQVVVGAVLGVLVGLLVYWVSLGF